MCTPNKQYEKQRERRLFGFHSAFCTFPLYINIYNIYYIHAPTHTHTVVHLGAYTSECRRAYRNWNTFLCRFSVHWDSISVVGFNPIPFLSLQRYSDRVLGCIADDGTATSVSRTGYGVCRRVVVHKRKTEN